MADTSIFMAGPKGSIRIKAIDNGDGSYTLATTAANGNGTTIFFYGPRGPVQIKAVDQGDGTYALLVA